MALQGFCSSHLSRRGLASGIFLTGAGHPHLGHLRGGIGATYKGPSLQGANYRKTARRPRETKRQKQKSQRAPLSALAGQYNISAYGALAEKGGAWQLATSQPESQPEASRVQPGPEHFVPLTSVWITRQTKSVYPTQRSTVPVYLLIVELVSTRLLASSRGSSQLLTKHYS